MITQREQRLISDVLQKAFLTEMPKKADNKSIWIEAIAKIRLSNNSIGYGIVKRNYDLSERVVYINGDTASIAEIVEVYPYVTLGKEYLKKFDKKEGEEARIKYLRSLNLPVTPADLNAMTLDGLNKEVVKAAVYQQLKDMERERK